MILLAFEIFLVIALVLVGAMFYTSEVGVMSFITFWALIGVIWWAGWFNPFAWGLVGVVALVAAFLLVGAVYVLLVMWPELLRSRQDYLTYIIRDWNDPKKAHMWVGMNSWKDTTDYKNRFTARANKAKLAGMIGLWPWDLLDKLLNKPIEWILQLSRHVFDAVGGRVVRSMERDIQTPNNEK